jgi:hypothetical protein
MLELEDREYGIRQIEMVNTTAPAVSKRSNAINTLIELLCARRNANNFQANKEPSVHNRHIHMKLVAVLAAYETGE